MRLPRAILPLIAFLSTMLALAAPARAQGVKLQSPVASASPASVASARPADEDAPDSPRASMRSFLDLCERGRYEEAARYLDLPRGSDKRGAELARKLQVVLAERVWINPDQLSTQAQGRTVDGLPAGTEELGRVKDAKGHTISVRIVRHESRSPEDEARWMFAQSTVLAVDALYAALEGKWLREHLPPPLLEEGPKGLYWWQWLALPVFAAVCFALGRVLAWLTRRLASKVLGRWPLSRRIALGLERPATMAWAVAAFWTLMAYLALTLRAEDLVERVLRALGWLAFFWALVRAVTIAGDEVAEADWARTRPSVRSFTSVGVRLGKVVVAALALMVALSELGYPATSVVAGLGIGGVVLALAAQKTVENLFGSVSILADQPFRVGDTIRVDGVEATVENIGLRSTRMRTVERTLVIIPNGKLADMRIESLGPRDRIRFSTKLQLARDTSVAQMRSISEAIRALLAGHALVRKEDVFVRVAALGEQSFDLDVAAPIETLDANEFARVKEELLFGCIEAVEAAGARLALPTRHMVGAKA
jgi:MscS family membrane protein